MKKNVFFIFIFSLLFEFGFSQDFKKIIKESKDDSSRVEAYTGLMKSFGPNRIDSVKFYAHQAIAYFDGRKYERGKCIMNLNMANVMLFNGGLAEAESYCKTAIAIAERENLPALLARGYDFMTVVYGTKGEFVKSVDFAYKALRANEKLNDHRGIIASYIKLSAISAELKKPHESLKYANIADSINTLTLKNIDLEIGITSNKAVAYTHLDKDDQALELFNKIYQITLDNPQVDDFHKPSALQNMGAIYLNKKDYQKAMLYFRQALEESLKYNLPVLELKSIQNIATTYQSLGDYKKSNKEAFVALQKSRALKTADIEIDQLQLIAENYKQLGDIEAALKYTSLYYDKRIAFNEDKNEKDIKELESLYRLEKAEEKLAVVQALNETRTKQRNLSILFSVVVLVCMLIFAFAYHRIRQLNKQNIETKNQLSESNLIKDKIFSIIGHDLRGSYSGTLNFLYLAQEKLLSEAEFDSMIHKVVKITRQGMETLDNLLIWGTAQLRGVKFNLTKFDSMLLIKRNLLLLEDKLQEKNLNIVNEIESGFFIEADQNHFEFIVRNLLSNAIKFTPDGGEITIGYKGESPKEHEFYIKDTGVGISEDRLAIVFTALGKSTNGTRDEKGTGLGLLLCKEFVELNGGNIRVESTLGRGTVFYFTFLKNLAA